ncbi:MAG: hypothetical protein H0V07_11695 [Propionibacteriales bacterium]|nr:hypothetical protein [Propionibacteriales bacterium]
MFWAASVLAEPGGNILRIVGLVVGAGAVLVALRRLSTSGHGAGQLTTKPRHASFNGAVFLAIVAAEVAAIRGGELLLNSALDIHVLDAAWVAFVVGLHFLAMGRLLHMSFAYPVGSIIAMASLGATVGYAAGWPAAALTLIAALPSAATLLASSWYGVVSGPRIALA